MILNRGRAGAEQVLKPEAVDLMSRNAMGDIKVTMLHTVAPALSNDAEFFPGMPKGWGLSFMINYEQAPTGRSAGSLAWAGLANTYFWIDPTRGLGESDLSSSLFSHEEDADGCDDQEDRSSGEDQPIAQVRLSEIRRDIDDEAAQ